MTNHKKILVTGSSAVLGVGLQDISSLYPDKEFVFTNSKDCNLTKIQETIDFAIELDLKFAKFLILKPFPGSEVYYQLNAKGLIDSCEYSEYGVYTAPVHHLDTLSQERILELQRLAFRKFYFRPKKIFEHIIAINTIEKFKIFTFGAWFVFMRIFSANNTRGRF